MGEQLIAVGLASGLGIVFLFHFSFTKCGSQAICAVLSLIDSD